MPAVVGLRWTPRAPGVVVALALAACSLKSPPARTGQTTVTDGRRQEIVALAAQIRQWRLDAGLTVEPSVEELGQAAERPVVTAAEACEAPPATVGTCGDVCRLADAICTNASTICRIADELPDDVWAAGKCHEGKASCQSARARCCGCSRPPTLGVP